MKNIPLPHLITAESGPLKALEQKILENQINIEKWFREKWQATPPPFYCSVDLRNAGFKLAPVDTNLFPGGFNNLHESLMPLCIQALQSTLLLEYPRCENILLIPENHTSNMNYFHNIARIQAILKNAGYAVQIGSLIPDIQTPTLIHLNDESNITLHPIQRKNDKLILEDFTPCLILLNNDLSDGTPDILKNIQQPIIPSPQLGWASRLKSTHFDWYDKITQEFSTLIDIDPWLINPYFEQCESINFMTGEGLDCLAAHIDTLLTKIQKKYNEYQLTETPYVAIKADAGTYGMGVMMVKSPEEILHLNRKQRSKMSASKGKKPITQVLLQEGVYTFETVGKNNSVAEPVIYMIGQYVVGAFYRIHDGKQTHDNLNAPGSHFHALQCVTPCSTPQSINEEIPNRFYSYGVIARLAALAAAHEDSRPL